MATRFYLVYQVNSPTFGSMSSGWEQGNYGGAYQGKLRTSIQSPYSAAQTYGSTFEVSTSTTYNSCLFSLVSNPLAAQTLTAANAAWTLRSFCLEDSGSANDYLAAQVRIIASDGTTVRSSYSFVVGSTEFDNGTITTLSSYMNRTVAGTHSTDIDIQAGDRIVLEVGYRATNNKSTTWYGAVSFGYHSIDSDAPANETQTDATAYNGWFEITGNLIFSDKSDIPSAVCPGNRVIKKILLR